nr:hypothetical protein [Tanacetum cinerariifolium]
MLVEQQVVKEGDADENVDGVNAGDTTEGVISAARRMIAKMDQDADVILEDDKEVADDAKEVAEDAKVDDSADI